MQRLIQQVRRAALPPDGNAASDGQLLDSFLLRRDPHAFEALVRRHGPMVLGVCRRVTGHSQDAEDAFQAVFLVLARKGDSVRPREMVGNWLYGVACRSALEARTRAARQQRRERPLLDMPDTTSPDQSVIDHAELRAILDDELRQLPDKLRSAVVLCELEGRSRQEVAQQLGVPEGTLSSRLAAARKRLAARLKQRGVVLPVSGLAALALPSGASACVPATLLAQTVQTGAQLAAGQPLAASGASATVRALTEGIMKSMLLNRLKSLFTLALACLLGLGIASGALWSAVAAPNDPPATEPIVAQPGGAGQPVEKPQAGRITVFFDDGFASLLPDGSDWNVLLAKSKKEIIMPIGLAVSPDGKTLAYLKMPEKAIVEAKKQGGRPDLRFKVCLKTLGSKDADKELDQTGAYLRWAHDGKHLLVMDPPTLDASIAKPNDPIALWLLNPATGDKTAITVPEGHFPTDFSPDGQWILTSARAEKGKGQVLARVSRDSGKVETLTPDKHRANFGRFSPDGKQIVFMMHKDPKDKGQVLAVRDLAKIDAEPTIISVLNGEVQGFCWSPDGRKIAYTWRERHDDEDPAKSVETEFHLVVIDRDGGNMTTLRSQKGPSQHSRTLGHLEWR